MSWSEAAAQIVGFIIGGSMVIAAIKILDRSNRP